ncbi:MAG TPA: hypothetical protein VKS20_04370 [Candidatus Acidoferrales bacterium]|nr:hypothetical protein [Candidatus Acidoferrales bacterium]
MTIFVSAWQQNNQRNPEKPDCYNQESKRQRSGTRGQRCQQQRRQAHKNSHSAKLGPVAHGFRFYAKNVFAPSVEALVCSHKVKVGPKGQISFSEA